LPRAPVGISEQSTDHFAFTPSCSCFTVIEAIVSPFTRIEVTFAAGQIGHDVLHRADLVGHRCFQRPE
jgi:hypothetical protein